MQATNEYGLPRRRNRFIRDLPEPIPYLVYVTTFCILTWLFVWCGSTVTEVVMLNHETETKNQLATSQYHSVLIQLNQRAIYLLMEIEKQRLVAPVVGTKI